MNATSTVTNEDLLEIMQTHMQMTSDGFARLDGRIDKVEVRLDNIEARLDSIENRLTLVERQLVIVNRRLDEHDLQCTDLSRQVTKLTEIVSDLSNNQKAYPNDIKDILDRLANIERQLPTIPKEEFHEVQKTLKRVVDWALKVAKKSNTPLHLP